MCKTESLCSTAKIKHSILHQLYFNKIIIKKSPSGLEPRTHLLSFQSSSGAPGPWENQVSTCWPLFPQRPAFRLRLATRGPPVWFKWCRRHSFPPNQPKHPGLLWSKAQELPCKRRTTSLRLQTLQVLGCRLVQREIKARISCQGPRGKEGPWSLKGEVPPSCQGTLGSATPWSAQTLRPGAGQFLNSWQLCQEAPRPFPRNAHRNWD